MSNSDQNVVSDSSCESTVQILAEDAEEVHVGANQIYDVSDSTCEVTMPVEAHSSEEFSQVYDEQPLNLLQIQYSTDSFLSNSIGSCLSFSDVVSSTPVASSSYNFETNRFLEQNKVLCERTGVMVIPQSTKRLRQGRKPKYQLTRKIAKEYLNHNKTTINYKGQLKNSKSADLAFNCYCDGNCGTKLSNQDKLIAFNDFHTMGSLQGRSAYLLSAVEKRSVKRHKKSTVMEAKTFKKEATYSYKLMGRRVCQKFFLKFLQISFSRVHNCFQKQSMSIPQKDFRGLKTGGKLVCDDKQKELVHEYINKFPLYESHYCRAKTNSTKYLCPGTTLEKMYAGFKLLTQEQGEQREVSRSTFFRIFYGSFNIKIKPLKKDTCLTCDRFKVNLEMASNPQEKTQLKNEHLDHLIKAEQLQSQAQEDKLSAQLDVLLEHTTIDFQKSHGLPMLPTSILYYMRLLNIQNFGIHASNGKGKLLRLIKWYLEV